MNPPASGPTPGCQQDAVRDDGWRSVQSGTNDVDPGRILEINFGGHAAGRGGGTRTRGTKAIIGGLVRGTVASRACVSARNVQRLSISYKPVSVIVAPRC